MKKWKNLFVKTEESGTEKKDTPSPQTMSFPISGDHTASHQPAAPYIPPPANDPALNEVLQVYENGLDSINMPGYDFFEFYKTVTSTGHPGEQTYQMAFQMAKTLDKTISANKLLSDAEFYISKINEVHSQYVTQGQQKLHTIHEKKSSEKNTLQGEIDRAAIRMNQLRTELQQLESEMSQKKNILVKVDDTYHPQEKTIREKLNANDMAQKASIDRLNAIKEGIQKFIKA